MAKLKIPIHIEVPYGESNNFSIYVREGQSESGTPHKVDSYNYYKVRKRMNNVWGFEILFDAITDTEKAYIKERAYVLIFVENTLFFKGRISKVDYKTAWECEVKGIASGQSKLLDKEFIKSGDKRVTYTNTSAQTIANEILSTNSDGVTPWIVEPATTGIFDTDYGNISMRYEYGNRLNCLAKLSEAIDYDWWVSISGLSDDYQTDYFNIATQKGSDQGVDFNISGDNVNCSLTKKETDTENLVNDVDALGYGDGVNQTKTNTYAASSTWTTLNENLTTTDQTITLTDASSFASSGEIRIMEERITYTGKSSNNLTGCTRASSSTTARVHKKGCYVEKYIAKGQSTAESGTSMNEYGVMDYTIIDKSIKDLPTLELVSSKHLIDRKDDITRIIVQATDPIDIAKTVELGDTVSITDAESDIDDDYRVMGINLIDEYGYATLEVECSNRNLEFIEQLQKSREEQENMSKYMQGSTNIYSIQSYENCDDGTDHELNIRFYIPADAIVINSVKLSFKLKDYRSYTSATQTAAAGGSNESVTIYDFYSSATSIGTSFTECDSNAMAATSSAGITYYFTFRNDTSANQHFYARIYDTTNGRYSPSSSGLRIADVVDNGTVIPTLCMPYNVASATIKMELKAGDSSGNCMLSGTLYEDGTHTHTITTSYAINEETLANPSVVVTAGADGGEDTVATYTTDQTDINVTTQITDDWTPGTGAWFNVKFAPNKRMRIEGNVFVKLFIEST